MRPDTSACGMDSFRTEFYSSVWGPMKQTRLWMRAVTWGFLRGFTLGATGKERGQWFPSQTPLGKYVAPLLSVFSQVELNQTVLRKEELFLELSQRSAGLHLCVTCSPSNTQTHTNTPICRWSQLRENTLLLLGHYGPLLVLLPSRSAASLCWLLNPVRFLNATLNPHVIVITIYNWLHCSFEAKLHED